MDRYLGYSSLFNAQFYRETYGQFGEYILDGEMGTLYGQDMNSLDSNYYMIWDTVDAQIKQVTFGDVQISIDDKNIIPYTYQTLEDIYKTVVSLYDVNDNKTSPNNQYNFPSYLKWYNQYIWKFDAKYGEKQKLLQPQYRGLKVKDAKSNIFCHLYNYNQYNNPPTPLNYDQFDPSTNKYSFFNSNSNKYQSTDKCWIDTPVQLEFIYYYSSLMRISKGDLTLVSNDQEEDILRRVPMYDETEYEIASSIPLLQEVMKKDEKPLPIQPKEEMMTQPQTQEQQIEQIQQTPQTQTQGLVK